MNNVINQRELRTIGLSRSGTHAICQWIMAQAEGRLCYLNCTEGKANPYQTARPMASGWPYEVNYSEFDIEAEQAGRFSQKDYLIFGHEDSFLGHACSPQYERQHDQWVGESAERYDVLILRDPFNLFASRLRQPHQMVKPKTAVRIWKQHARQFLQRPDRLRHTPVLINYNQWFTDVDYRRQVAQQMGLRFTDEGRDRVPTVFGGSSFDGLQYDGRASQMKVLERWRYWIDDEAYTSLFDEELLSLSEALFGSMPAALVPQFQHLFEEA